MIFGIPLTPFNVINFTVLLMTFWVGMIRYSRGNTSNLPILYWVGVIAHMRFFQGGYDYRWVFGGVACALFLRFEFMNRTITLFFQVLEFLVLAYVLWRTIGLILLW